MPARLRTNPRRDLPGAPMKLARTTVSVGLAAGALVFGAAGLCAQVAAKNQIPAWSEEIWPFPIDQWVPAKPSAVQPIAAAARCMSICGRRSGSADARQVFP